MEIGKVQGSHLSSCDPSTRMNLHDEESNDSSKRAEDKVQNCDLQDVDDWMSAGDAAAEHSAKAVNPLMATDVKQLSTICSTIEPRQTFITGQIISDAPPPSKSPHIDAFSRTQPPYPIVATDPRPFRRPANKHLRTRRVVRSQFQYPTMKKESQAEIVGQQKVPNGNGNQDMGLNANLANSSLDPVVNQTTNTFPSTNASMNTNIHAPNPAVNPTVNPTAQIILTPEILDALISTHVASRLTNLRAETVNLCLATARHEVQHYLRDHHARILRPLKHDLAELEDEVALFKVRHTGLENLVHKLRDDTAKFEADTINDLQKLWAKVYCCIPDDE